MPNRILRDGILTSEAVASLSWSEEVFYRRLMSVADDHGRFHAAPKLIRAACYPLLIDKVSDADIGKWLTSCVTAALVSVYPAADGKRYLQILKFGQQVRSASKFPEPVADNGQPLISVASNCYQVPAVAHLDEGVFVVEDEGDKPARNRTGPPDGVDLSVWTDFQKLRRAKRAPLTDTAIAGIKREAEKAGISLNDALRTSVERGWAGFKAEWVAAKPNPADIARVTVPGPTGRDPALLKADKDDLQAAPMPAFARELAARLTGKANAQP